MIVSAEAWAISVKYLAIRFGFLPVAGVFVVRPWDFKIINDKPVL